MQNTFKKIQHAIAVLGLSLGLFMSSFASHAIILEYDYETVNAANNEYLFNFSVSGLSAYTDTGFDLYIEFDYIASGYNLEDANFTGYGASVTFDNDVDPGFPLAETSVPNIFFEFFPWDNFLGLPTAVSLFSDGLISYDPIADGAITGISLILQTNGILPSDLAFQMIGEVYDANFDLLEDLYATPVSGSNTTVVQPPTAMPSPSIAALFFGGVLLLTLRRKTKK